METIAVYFESRIRTYGFNLREKLLLCELTVRSDSTGILGRELQSLAASSKHFHLVWACPAGLEEMTFFLLCDHVYQPEIDDFGKRQEALKTVKRIRCQRSMELVYFQGPHYGDRHGIVDFTLKALAPYQIIPEAMTCSGAAVYLVFANTVGQTAKAVLSRAFDVPKGKKTN